MDSSATLVWSDGGRSKVEAMTSPFTDRVMSVTSSGRSSTSTTMRWHSGLLVVMALAMACSTIVLPAFGGLTIRARCPLPRGHQKIAHAVGERVWLGLEPQPLVGVERGELGELRPVPGLLGRDAV